VSRGGQGGRRASILGGAHSGEACHGDHGIRAHSAVLSSSSVVPRAATGRCFVITRQVLEAQVQFMNIPHLPAINTPGAWHSTIGNHLIELAWRNAHINRRVDAREAATWR
jgi:hypothetical protein